MDALLFAVPVIVVLLVLVGSAATPATIAAAAAAPDALDGNAAASDTRNKWPAAASPMPLPTAGRLRCRLPKGFGPVVPLLHPEML